MPSHRGRCGWELVKTSDPYVRGGRMYHKLHMKCIWGCGKTDVKEERIRGM